MKTPIPECQFEACLLMELQLGSPAHFRPSQVLERLLPFDLAVTPEQKKVWSILEMDAPRGVVFSGMHATGVAEDVESINQSEQLPGFWTSLFLQCKRPEYLKTARANQWNYWEGPYYRVGLENAEQHLRLLQLERRLGRRGCVRYASPACHTSARFFELQVDGRVLDNTNFASPTDIGIGHTCWTYDRAGTRGYANEEPKELATETFELVRARLLQKQGTDVRFERHLEGLASIVEEFLDKPQRRRFENIERSLQEFDIERARTHPLTNMLIISQTMEWHHIKWVPVRIVTLAPGIV